MSVARRLGFDAGARGPSRLQQQAPPSRSAIDRGEAEQISADFVIHGADAISLALGAMAADVISFARGAPSADILPKDAVREAAAAALETDWQKALSYGTGIGHPGPLRVDRDRAPRHRRRDR